MYELKIIISVIWNPLLADKDSGKQLPYINTTIHWQNKTRQQKLINEQINK